MLYRFPHGGKKYPDPVQKSKWDHVRKLLPHECGTTIPKRVLFAAKLDFKKRRWNEGRCGQGERIRGAEVIANG